MKLWFFFFCKQKTAYEMRISDWSSDVCSSDLIPAPDEALPGREERWFPLAERHLVLDAPLVTDESNIPEGYEVAVFGLGCFWGAEEIYWQMPGVWSTSVGDAGGITPPPSSTEVCSGRTAHDAPGRVVSAPPQGPHRQAG